jgi:hypothetical protein
VECRYLDAPADFRESFCRALKHAADTPDAPLTPSERAALLAGCFLIKGSLNQSRELLVLARDERLRHLQEDSLQYGVNEFLRVACQELETIGVLAVLPWTLERLPAERRVTIKGLNYADEAYLVLAGLVERIRAGQLSFDEAEAELSERGPLLGVAYTDETPPAWTGLSDAESCSAFLRLRRSCCPEIDTIREASGTTLAAGLQAVLRGDRKQGEELLREAIRMFDLLGWIDQQIATRLTLVETMLWPGLPLTDERYREMIDFLKTAERMAEGLPEQTMHVGALTGLVLKQAGFGNETQRLEEAKSILRNALAVARANGITERVSEAAVNFASALMEDPLRTYADLEEAQTILGGLVRDFSHPTAPLDRGMLGVAHNNLGNLLLQKWQTTNSLQDLRPRSHR